MDKAVEVTKSILEVTGIGPATAKILADHGIHSAVDLAGAPLSAIMAVPGFSEVRASRAIDAAKKILGEAPSAPAAAPAKPKKKAPEKKAKKDKAAKREKKSSGTKKAKPEKSKKTKEKKSKKEELTKKNKKAKADKKSGKKK